MEWRRRMAWGRSRGAAAARIGQEAECRVGKVATRPGRRRAMRARPREEVVARPEEEEADARAARGGEGQCVRRVGEGAQFVWFDGKLQ
ncbi:hypothetical protein [Oryza sativa Japonica Group]|uniref:Uncharacterized protein n=1 Tax=Oryza sativa subsp. japonica TaxID=39947 RepID=Q5QNE7_ORYSJ|nr:hypothetical protein [Oryza sativa Japonica Group]BAD81410.1 hypothetical protein [Oryza sativa Japonica Group]